MCGRQEERTTSTHDSSRVVLIWLAVQLLASFVMSVLSILHFVQIFMRPDSSCAAMANLSAENDANYTSTVSAGPSWELSAVSMSFILVSLIITIIDSTINMRHYDLIHREGGAGCECKNVNLPAGLFRVYYCWILIHLILITVAANTYKWSWQTDDDLDVLSHTFVFFISCIFYLLLVVAMFTRLAYGCISEHNPPHDHQLPPDHQPPHDHQLVFSIILTTGLVVSHISCTIATLVVLFSNEPDLDCLGRVAVGLPVAVYVFLSSSLWLLLNYCFGRQENTNPRMCYGASITVTLLVVLLSIGSLVACLSSVLLLMNPLKRLSLLLFSFPLIPWLVLLCFLMCTTSTCTSFCSLKTSATAMELHAIS